eukprot:GSChrysophyteH2.ASY1.ANO1.472.1 assembled CDS
MCVCMYVCVCVYVCMCVCVYVCMCVCVYVCMCVCVYVCMCVCVYVCMCVCVYVCMCVCVYVCMCVYTFPFLVLAPPSLPSLTTHSSLLTPHSSLLTPLSSLPTPHSSLLTPHTLASKHSGKSTLVNALVGVTPRKGPAGISDRAGWTDQVCFYRLGKKPPRLTLADLPGYGHAIATVKDLRAWKAMTHSYLQTRPNLSRCCLLVDCTRGLCRGDKELLKFLEFHGVTWHLVLTKADLLDASELAQSMLAVQADADRIVAASAVAQRKRAEKVSACVCMHVYIYSEEYW